jgi:uncharacterized membrane protein YGL010W
MQSLDAYFSSYAAYHQTCGNKLTHYFGIPLIVFAVLGLLGQLGVSEWMNLAWLAWLLSSIFYCRLDLKRGLAFSVVTFILCWCALRVVWPIHIGLFIIGWLLQLYGHYHYEKKSPAFLTNLTHLLIGPFWIFCDFFPGKIKGLQ